MRYIYHYHLQCQLDRGQITNVDGTVLTQGRIESFKDYSNLKRELAAIDNLPAEKVTICNLSLLHEIPAAADRRAKRNAKRADKAKGE